MKKLAVIITHPIQYYVPVFQLLAKECQLKVFYTWGEGWILNRYDPGFGKNIEWDIPLLDGYAYEFIENTAKEPGSHHKAGIINPKLIESIINFQPNAILVHGYAYDSHLKLLRYFKGKTPVWFRGDSTLLDEKFGIKSILKTIYLRWVYKHIDKAFYVGTRNKSYFLKYGLKEEQLKFVPHAIDNKRFSENRYEEVKKLKRSLNIGIKDITILFAGKLELKKDPTILLDAFIKTLTRSHIKESEQQIEKVHLIFVGNGPLENDLKIEVTNLKLNNVHFLGFQNQTQMPIIYQLCDIFCLPSKGPGETWGLAINEAMAAHKAIIASDKVGCALDLVENGVNGYVFPHGDINSLNEIILFFINNQEYLKQYGLQSNKIIKNWNFQKQVEAIIDQLYEY